jgi:hypothetical protein
VTYFVGGWVTRGVQVSRRETRETLHIQLSHSLDNEEGILPYSRVKFHLAPRASRNMGF